MTSGMDPLKISLDEYIAKCQQSDKELFPAKNEQNFKSGRRNYDVEEDEEVSDDIVNSELNSTSEIDSNTAENYLNDDNFIPFGLNIGDQQVLESENNSLIDNVSKTGYDLRLKLIKKPSAQIPTLFPLEKKVNNEYQLNNRNLNTYHKYNRRRFNVKGYWNRGNNKHELWTKKQKHTYTKHHNKTKSHNCSCNTNEQTVGINSPKNLHIQINDISQTSPASTANLKITFDRDTPQTNDSLSHNDGGFLNNPSPINLTSAAMETLDAVGNGQRLSDVYSTNENDIQSLLGVSGSVQAKNISELAKKFLDFLQNGTQQIVHKPIYDMKIQKQIHELQRKQLRYCKPGGEIVTGDGPGINNCKIKPNASGISLNCRFI